MARLSNAGRRGKEDQLGTLNLVTRAKRGDAAQSVRDGVSMSLASDVLARPGPNVAVPMRFFLETIHVDAALTCAVDAMMVVAHGFSSTHLDALSHVVYRGRMNNGVPRDRPTPEGAKALGVETLQAGIVTRGVLVDLPGLALVH